MYNKKIKEMAIKNKEINKVSSIIFEYEQQIKEIKKQIENENKILLQLKKDYKTLSDEAEKIRKLS
ncbi:hypothetical protein [Aliarcobacter cryaerophilus]|uniref:hypothetical protein n=1 Tax=Aliarcobacter cryaerophilus TaxID=28198 RepID=UPI0013DDEF0E|nr:hypothetical protein [Aliarcobacter cryaerophilus]